MKYVVIARNRKITNDELIEDLKNVAASLHADTVSLDEYNQHGRFRAVLLTQRLGSWERCLELAGLEQSPQTVRHPQDELLDDISRVWAMFGKRPTYSQMQKHTKYSMEIYESKFGGFHNAIECFASYNVVPYLENVIATLRNEVSAISTSPIIDPRIRHSIFVRDGFCCCACGASPANDGGVTKLLVDHVIPLSKGGSNVFVNLITLCEQCKRSKGGMA